MRRSLMIVTVTALAMAAAAQDSKPQNSQAQPATAAPVTGRGTIQAKTQAEYDAYQVIKNKTQTPDELAKAADDFAARFPDSNLRILLYRGVMQSYQTAGDSDKMMAAGMKVLSIDKDDPEALVAVAEVQEERTSPMDLDREQRMEQAIGNAQHGLQTIDSDLAVPAGVPDDRVEAYKKYLRSTALAIVGTVQYKREQYAESEATLRKAIEADSANPDAVVILRLALALDQQKKYQEALEQANRAVELTKEDTDVGRMARNEKERLVVQTGGNNTPEQPAQPAGAPVSTPTAAPNTPPAAATAPQNQPPASH